jgi:hypothetical protein
MMTQSYLLCAALLWGQAESKPAEIPLTEHVKKKVVLLDDEDQAVRDAAEKSLIDLGEPVLNFLPQTQEGSSTELKARLARIRSTIEKQSIEAHTKPSQVTLQGEMELSEAIAAFEKQTGNKFVDYRERFNQQVVDPTIKLDLKEASFWEACDTLLDAAELTLYNYTEGETTGKLPFMARGDATQARHGNASYAGLFRIQPTSLQANRDLRNPMANGLTLTTDLVWEPRIRPIVILVPLEELIATDDAGTVIATETESTLEIPVETTNSGIELSLQLGLPARTAKKIAKISGNLVAVVQGRTETFEFTNLEKAKDVAIERGGAVVTLEQVRKNDEVQEFRIRLKFDKSANALESHRGWIYNNEAYLVNGKNERIENGGLEARLVEENEVGMAYLFDLGEHKLADLKFVYRTPAAIFKIPVTFKLSEIELP